VTTLLEIMADSKSPAAVRVRAAESALRDAEQSSEFEDLEERVYLIEQGLKRVSEAQEKSKQEERPKTWEA